MVTSGLNWLPEDVGRVPAIWNWIALGCTLLAALLWAVWQTRRRSRTSEPACGRCGYFVTGLSGTVCPECGSDLRAVGVVAPGDARQAPTRFRLAVLTLLLPLPIVLSWQLVHPVLPKRHSTMSIITLSQPASGAYRQIRIEASGQRWSFIPRRHILPMDLSIRVDRESEHDLYFFADLERPVGDKRTVDFGDGRTYIAPLVRTLGYINRDVLLEWLVRDGQLDRDDALRAEMQELELLLQKGMRGGGFTPVAGPNWSSVSAGGGGSLTTPPWMLAAWIVLWVIVALLIGWRIRRRAKASELKSRFSATTVGV